MHIHSHPKFNLAYGLLPNERNQDIIKIIPRKGDFSFSVSVVDGWNWKGKIKDDRYGRRAALVVAEKFPRIFLQSSVKNYRVRAEQAAQQVDELFLRQWPKYVSAVGMFLFVNEDMQIIVFVGKGTVLTWVDRAWKKPREIGDYFLDETKFGFPNEVSRFFGRGELKGNPLYSCKPDVVVCPSGTPVFLATDGLEDIFTLEEIKEMLRFDHGVTPQVLINHLFNEVTRRGTQRDDISVLVRL